MQRARTVAEDHLSAVADDDRRWRGHRLDQEISCRGRHVTGVRTPHEGWIDQQVRAAKHERMPDAFEEPWRMFVPLLERIRRDVQSLRDCDRDVRIEDAPTEPRSEQRGQLARA